MAKGNSLIVSLIECLGLHRNNERKTKTGELSGPPLRGGIRAVPFGKSILGLCLCAKAMVGNTTMRVRAWYTKNKGSVSTVAVPDGVPPGGTFYTIVNDFLCVLTCPAHHKPGQNTLIQMKTPPKLPKGESIQKVEGSNPPAYYVVIPPGTRGGEHFLITIDGARLNIKCPHRASPGIIVKVRPPLHRRLKKKKKTEKGSRWFKTKHRTAVSFEAMVPETAIPGKPFSVPISGRLSSPYNQNVLVMCPMNAVHGDRVVFKVPRHIVLQTKQEGNEKDDSMAVKERVNSSSLAVSSSVAIYRGID